MSSESSFNPPSLTGGINRGNLVAGLILAAGQGTRMKSPIPKVLHKVAGDPMIHHVTKSLQAAGIRHICAVIGEDNGAFTAYLREQPTLRVCVQKIRNGTAGAVAAASDCFIQGKQIPWAPSFLLRGQPLEHEFVLICAGDTPALDSNDLKDFIKSCLSASVDIGVLGMDIPNPYGYGRLITETGSRLRPLRAIVEERDAGPSEREVTICNSGVILARTSVLFALLPEVNNNNAQKEYYLTNIIALARQQRYRVLAFISQNWQNFLGVNTPEQLSQVGRFMGCRKLSG